MKPETMQKLSEVYRNDDALKFAHDICNVLNFWDALGTGVEVKATRMNQCMWMALVDLPKNKFYRSNFDALHPLVIQAIVDWMTAIQIEMKTKPSAAEMERAYNCRQAHLGLLVTTAGIANGAQFAASVGPVIREILDDGGLRKYIAQWKTRPAPSA